MLLRESSFCLGTFQATSRHPVHSAHKAQRSDWRESSPGFTVTAQLTRLHSGRGSLAVRMGNCLSLATESALQSKSKEFGSDVTFNYLAKREKADQGYQFGTELIPIFALSFGAGRFCLTLGLELLREFSLFH